MTAQQQIRAAIYCRISQDRDKDELGVDRQREGAEKLAADRGYEVAGIYTDNNISASTGRHRPAYAAMMEAAAVGEFSVIVVFHLSRLWRNRRERAEGIELLSKARVSVACTKGLEFDMTSATGRGVTSLIGEVDSMEGELKAERVVEAQAAAAQAGRWIGGPRPFGWDLEPDPALKGTKREHRLVVPVINAAEAAEIRRLAAALLEGRSLGSLCRDLNSRGIRTTWDKTWDPVSLRKVLARPRNYGASEYDGVLYPDTWPAIFTEETHLKIVALLADPARRRSTSNRVKYLLSGIAICGVPGCTDDNGQRTRVKSGSTTNRDGSRRRLYRCPAEHVFRAQQDCDTAVRAEIIFRLSKLAPEARLALLAGEDADSPAAAEVSRLRGKLSQFAELFREDMIEPAEYKHQVMIVKGQLARAQKQMSRVSRVPVLHDLLAAGDIAAAWDALPLDRQRAVLGELLTVVIMPGRRMRGRGLPVTAATLGIGIRWHITGLPGISSEGYQDDGIPLDELEQAPEAVWHTLDELGGGDPA
jgi:DNA invertase Pin-like site-specific DNA recombinase